MVDNGNNTKILMDSDMSQTLRNVTEIYSYIPYVFINFLCMTSHIIPSVLGDIYSAYLSTNKSPSIVNKRNLLNFKAMQTHMEVICKAWHSTDKSD